MRPGPKNISIRLILIFRVSRVPTTPVIEVLYFRPKSAASLKFQLKEQFNVHFDTIVGRNGLAYYPLKKRMTTEDGI